MVWGMDGIGSGPEDFGIFGMLEKAFSSEQCKEIEENNRIDIIFKCIWNSYQDITNHQL